MAPSKTAKTPSKAARPPASKKKTTPNASILSFFKKAPRPDESMFVGDAYVPPGGFDGDEDGGLYDDEPADERYNESQTPSKKRKSSPLHEVDDIVCGGSRQRPADGGSGVDGTNGQRKPSRKGPFVDDSDSDEDEPDSRAPGPASAPKTEVARPAATRLDAATLSGASGGGGTPEVAPPPPLTFAPSADEYFDGLDDMDFPDEEDCEGEENRERRFMEEQARLEAEEAANYSCDETVEMGQMEESCPICASSLAGISANEATVHVNACLDGHPTPLPAPAKVDEQSPGNPAEVDGSELSKRFARAAQPRPGQANPFALGPAAEAAGSAFAKLMSGHAEDAAWATAAAAENASRGMPAYRRTCPFYKIMPGFFICVDAFRYGAVEGCRAYFLSHFHSDHYVGLTANWCHGPIYCSKVTASLVKSQLRTADQWVIELDFEETVDVPGTEGVSVTMIPANHCPGSSLFLFEKTVQTRGRGSSTQRILHCGDFRACAAHVEHPLLRPETLDAVTGRSRQQKIDVCYLDTTYLSPRYSFPPQEDVVAACAELCVSLDRSLRDGDDSRWEALLRRRDGGGAAGTASVSRFFTKDVDADAAESSVPAARDALSALGKTPPRLLVVCGTYSIGKERICKAIARSLKTKIYASPSKIRIVNQLGDPELAAMMTSKPHEAQVHMQILMEMRAETLADYLAAYRTHFSRVVGFRPSGWNFRPQGPMAGRGGANLQPGSLPTTQLLHGPAWKAGFGARDMVPQRGSTREAVCLGVPYSEHSSFRELALFIMALRIERVVPTVNVGSEPSRKRMKAWLDRWIAERRRGGVVRVLADAGEGEGLEAEAENVGGKPAPRTWDGKDGRGGGVYW